MRLASITLLIAALLLPAAPPARAFDQAALVDGFMRSVFGSEFSGWGWQANIVKKYTVPVRFYVDDRSGRRGTGEVVRFIRALPHRIAGLQASIVDQPGEANFRVFVVDRDAYRGVVAGEIYGQPSSGFAPGKCLVRVVSGLNGISRSDAVIVADEGDFLFRRCMVEEILQGLGPVNDDPVLAESVFNDTSTHARFTAFDRHILNMLYDPRIQPGMGRIQVRRLLPAVAADTLRRLQ
jgi:hypothetical protein